MDPNHPCTPWNYSGQIAAPNSESQSHPSQPPQVLGSFELQNPYSLPVQIQVPIPVYPITTFTTLDCLNLHPYHGSPSWPSYDPIYNPERIYILRNSFPLLYSPDSYCSHQSYTHHHSPHGHSNSLPGPGLGLIFPPLLNFSNSEQPLIRLPSISAAVPGSVTNSGTALDMSSHTDSTSFNNNKKGIQRKQVRNDSDSHSNSSSTTTNKHATRTTAKGTKGNRNRTNPYGRSDVTRVGNAEIGMISSDTRIHNNQTENNFGRLGNENDGENQNSGIEVTKGLQNASHFLGNMIGIDKVEEKDKEQPSSHEKPKFNATKIVYHTAMKRQTQSERISPNSTRKVAVAQTPQPDKNVDIMTLYRATENSNNGVTESRSSTLALALKPNVQSCKRGNGSGMNMPNGGNDTKVQPRVSRRETCGNKASGDGEELDAKLHWILDESGNMAGSQWKPFQARVTQMVQSPVIPLFHSAMFPKL